MSEPNILFRTYVDSIRVKSAHAKALARQIYNAAPVDISPRARTSLELVIASADDVQRTLVARERVSAESIGAMRLGVINAVGALFGALDSMSRTPPEVSDRGLRAKAVLRKGFPDDISFIKEDAPALWASGLRRLEEIETHELRDEIVSLVGEDMLVGVEQALAALGEALGAGSSARHIPSSNALREKSVTLWRAIGTYCRLLSAEVDLADEASIDRFRKAVAPIDEYRAQHPIMRRGEEDELDVDEDVDVVEPAEPTPVVEPVPEPVVPQPAE